MQCPKYEACYIPEEEDRPTSFEERLTLYRNYFCDVCYANKEFTYSDLCLGFEGEEIEWTIPSWTDV